MRGLIGEVRTCALKKVERPRSRVLRALKSTFRNAPNPTFLQNDARRIISPRLQDFHVIGPLKRDSVSHVKLTHAALQLLNRLILMFVQLLIHRFANVLDANQTIFQ